MKIAKEIVRRMMDANLIPLFSADGHNPEIDCALEIIAAKLEPVKKAGQFKRNTCIHDNPDFEGEWIAVPREDFDAFKAALALFEEE